MKFKTRSLCLSDYTLIDGVHRLFEASNKSVLIDIRTSLLHEVSEYIQTPINTLEPLHTQIDINDVTSIRLHLVNFLNSTKYNWTRIEDLLSADNVHHMIGPDYLLQKKINISIQMPGDAASTLAMHSDCISGDSPWQLNLWIPLTKVMGTSSIYLVSTTESINILDKLGKLDELNTKSLAGYTELSELMNACDKEYIKEEFGMLSIIHPGVLHGNDVNTTDNTRVSLNIRIKSIFRPDIQKDHPDRGVGSYYQLSNLSSQYLFSKKLTKYVG